MIFPEYSIQAYHNLKVILISQKLDVSPPKCSVMTQSGTCASVFGRQECVSATWHARVNFSDSGEGLLSITTRDNVEGSLKGNRRLEQEKLKLKHHASGKTFSLIS